MSKLKLTLLFLLSISLFGCYSNRKIEEGISNSHIDRTSNEDDHALIIDTSFTSSIRPNEAIFLNKIYTDTLEFSSYNDDGDYFHLIGKKQKQSVSLIYNWEWYKIEKYNFQLGDPIEVKWKMDSIWIAGEDDELMFYERAIDAKKIVLQ